MTMGELPEKDSRGPFTSRNGRRLGQDNHAWAARQRAEPLHSSAGVAASEDPDGAAVGVVDEVSTASDGGVDDAASLSLRDGSSNSGWIDGSEEDGEGSAG